MIMTIVVSSVILLIVVGIYASLAFLSEKRSHCVQGGSQMCGNEDGGCCGSRQGPIERIDRAPHH